jgi:hypothetical protein
VLRRTLGLSEEYTRRFGAELAKLGCPLGEVEKPGMPPKLPDPADAANPNQASLPEQDLLNRSLSGTAETCSRTAGKYGYNSGVLFDFLAKAGYSLTDLVESNSEGLPIARIGAMTIPIER